MELSDNKAELRREIRQRKKSVPAKELSRQSEQLCRSVISTDWWREAKVVLLYAALPDEVDVQMLVDDARREDKLVLLPVVVGDVLELHPFDGETRIGAFGITEPIVKGDAFVDYHEIDVAIIPGMAFDGQGHRLGRGKGFYDRLLCDCPSMKKVGICFDFQMVENVPSEPHDIVMDEVI